MAQFGYPTSDVTNQWASGGFADLDEGATPDDGDFAYSNDKPSSEILELHLGDVTDPEVSTGHVVRYHWATVDGGVLSGDGTAVTQIYEIYQGTTLIETLNTHTTNNASWQSVSATMIGTNVDNITDYTDLRLRITASGGAGSPADRRGAACSWIEFETPNAPTGHTFTPAAVTAAFGVVAPTVVLATVVLSPLPVTAAFSVPAPTLDVIEPLTRDTVGLLAVYIANDGDDPFVATDWELQSNTSAVQVDGTTGELEFESQGLGRMRHSGTGASSRSKRMVQGLVYSPSSPPAGNPQNYPGIAGHMETGSGGDDALLIVGVLTNDGGGDGYAVTEDAAGVQEGTTGGGLPYKAYDIDYRFSIYVNGSSAATGHDFDQAESQNLTPVVLTSGHAGIIGCCNNDWANWKEWWDTKDRNILCNNMPTGYKLKVRNSSDSVLKSATESSGTATLDVIDISYAAIDHIVATDGSDNVVKIFRPGPTSDYVVGGDIYNYTGGAVTLTPSAVTAAWSVVAPTITIGTVTLTPSSVTGAWTVVDPTVVIGAVTLTPAAVAAVLGVPAPTVATGALTLTPAAVTASFGVVNPTVVLATISLTPASVVAAFGVVAPTIVQGGVTVTPSAVTAAWSVVDPTVVPGGVTISPAAVTANFSVPAPTLSIITTLTPAAVTAAFGVVAPTISIGAITLSPAAVTAALSVVAPTVAIGSVTLTPAAVTGIFSVPAPAVNIGALILTPAAVTAALTVQDPSVATGAVTLTPAAVAAAFSAVAPTISIPGITLTPSAAIAAWSVPTATTTAGQFTILAAPVTAAWNVPTATLSIGQILTPAAVTAAFAVPAPTVTLGGKVLVPSPTSAAWSVVDPAILTGAVSLSPAPTSAAWTSPGATIQAGAITLLATPTSAVWSVPAAALQVGALSLSATPTTAVFSVPAHSLLLGPTNLTPAAVIAAWTAVDAVITTGAAVLTPAPVIAVFTVVPPTVIGPGGPAILVYQGGMYLGMGGLTL